MENPTVTLNREKLFDLKIDGKPLTINQMLSIRDYYEACCTAEYLIDNHSAYGINNDTIAIKLGYQVRESMADNDYSENVAIEELINHLEESDLEI